MKDYNTIYALLIGINEYASPSVPPLGGTHKDVGDVKNYLETNYPTYAKSIVTIVDQDATRANIIKYFEQHLAKAEQGDVALLYYSGHGSWCHTNDAFIKFDPDGKEEGFVCHDSRTNGKFDLSDKELAVLLNYVAQNDAEVVMLVDSCHSGSITRAAATKSRMTEGFDQKRGIDTYLVESTVPENQLYYKKKLEEEGDVMSIPLSRHLLMSSCSENELAREDGDGGWFTQSLLKVLREAKEPLSYFQTYKSLFSIIAQKDEKQTPQLEGYNMFNSNNTFITGTKNNYKQKRFKITTKQDTGDYRIDFCAQAGFPMNVSKPVNFEIYEQEEGGEPVGTGKVRSIGIVDSDIKLRFEDLVDGTVFWAEILDLAITPLTICFEGHAEDLARISEILEAQQLQQIVLVENDKVCPFVIAWQEESSCYRLSEKGRPVFILEFDQGILNNDHKVGLLIETLEQLSQWHYTVNLEKRKTKINKEDIVVKFTTAYEDEAEYVTCEQDEFGELVEMELEEANQNPQYNKITAKLTDIDELEYNVSLSNFSDEAYHVAVMMVTCDHGVVPLTNNLKVEAGGTIEQLIDPNYTTLTVHRDRDFDITHHIKILISKEEIRTIQGFEMQQFKMEQQLKLLTNKRNFAPRRGLNDWCTKTLSLNIKREKKQLGKKDLQLYRGGIILHGHPQLTADVLLTKPAKNTRASEQLIFSRGSSLQLEYLSRSGSRAMAANSLELSYIQHVESLQEEPLKISVPKKGNDVILPFSVKSVATNKEDGSFANMYVPVGLYGVGEAADQDVFEIKALPLDVPNKITKSQGNAAKLFFAKILPQRGRYNLTWVDYNTHGGQRVERGVAAKVTEAQNILVLVHGILSDTTAMVKNVAFAQEHYDLILCYDYDSLTTEIGAAAADLKAKLAAAGIAKDCGKNVDILAHSTGGLVARFLIETPLLMEGDGFIRRLFMLGTPNGGTAFSYVTPYKNLAATALTLMLNTDLLGKPNVLSTFLGGLKADQPLPKTLESLHKDSELFKQLNSNTAPTNTKYYVVAGNAQGYPAINDPVIERAAQWAKIQSADWDYGTVANDLLATMDSILAVPSAFAAITTTLEVDCSNIMYLMEEKTISALKEWMQGNS